VFSVHSSWLHASPVVISLINYAPRVTVDIVRYTCKAFIIELPVFSAIKPKWLSIYDTLETH